MLHVSIYLFRIIHLLILLSSLFSQSLQMRTQIYLYEILQTQIYLYEILIKLTLIKHEILYSF